MGSATSLVCNPWEHAPTFPGFRGLHPGLRAELKAHPFIAHSLRKPGKHWSFKASPLIQGTQSNKEHQVQCKAKGVQNPKTWGVWDFHHLNIVLK